MKKILLSLFVVLSSNIAAFSGKIAELPQGSVLEAKFIQNRFLKGIPKPIKSEGNMVLWEGKGLAWNTLSPFPNSILINKKGLYQLQDKMKTPMVKAGGDNTMFDIMAGIFNLRSTGQVKGFTIVELPANKGGWRIRLLPQHRQVQNFIGSITVDGGEQITHITIARPNGDRDEIEVKNHEVKNTISFDIKELFYE